METRKQKRRPQDLDWYSYTVPVGTSLAPDKSTVREWSTYSIPLSHLGWHTAVLSLEGNPNIPIFYAATYVNNRDPFVGTYFQYNTQAKGYYTAGGPPVTSGDVAVSMTSWLATSSAGLIYGLVEAIETASASSSVAATTGSQTISSVTPSRTSSEQQNTPTASPPASTAPVAGASDSSLGSGAIAGIAIGGVLLFALIIGGWYFWRRRKRTKSTTKKDALESDERAGEDGEKKFYEAPVSGARQEMSGHSPAQELYPSSSYRYMAHELGSYDVPGELPHAGVCASNYGGETEMTVAARDDTTSYRSPHIEAQRKRELEWLKMEEERIRKRQETLLRQGSGKIDESREGG